MVVLGKLLLCASSPLLAVASCPFLANSGASILAHKNPHAKSFVRSREVQVQAAEYDVVPIKKLITDILVDEAADFGNYGPFFMRLAWHCSGTYRTSDGRGGCDGGRIRLAPEKDWEDDAGLNEALDLLRPIKAAHPKISWGDLIVLAGSTSMTSMGGPEVAFCGGRVDDEDGSESLLLEDSFPGKDHLIYVDAGTATGKDIRQAFKMMDFDDKTTVALVAGGHAFGQCHSSRSGFQGAWTLTPTTWSNSYLWNLMTLNYTLVDLDGDGGKQQYNHTSGIMMLVADFNMKLDAEYLVHMEHYKANPDELKADFGKAWERLMTRDMGHKPCLGAIDTREKTKVDYAAVGKDVKAMLKNDKRATDFGHYGPLFVRFAWHCSGTYRSTDYRGGCDGARIMHAPEKDWPDNDGLVVGADEPQEELAVALLTPVMDKHKASGLTWADLIITAGTTALEDMGAKPVRLCPNRLDATASEAAEESKLLDPTIYLNPENATAADVKKSMVIMGFTAQEMTVLNGGGHAIGKAHKSKSGFEGAWTASPTTFSNSFFSTLLDNTWVEEVGPGGRMQFKDQATSKLMMLHTDMAFKNDAEFAPFTKLYKDDNNKFLEDFAKAWEKLINADRYYCLPEDGKDDGGKGSDNAAPSAFAVSSGLLLALVAGAALA